MVPRSFKAWATLIGVVVIGLLVAGQVHSVRYARLHPAPPSGALVAPPVYHSIYESTPTPLKITLMVLVALPLVLTLGTLCVWLLKDRYDLPLLSLPGGLADSNRLSIIMVIVGIGSAILALGLGMSGVLGDLWYIAFLVAFVILMAVMTQFGPQVMRRMSTDGRLGWTTHAADTRVAATWTAERKEGPDRVEEIASHQSTRSDHAVTDAEAEDS